MSFLIPVYVIISYTHCLYARAPSLFLTHSLDHFLTTLDLLVQILDVYFIDQVFVEIVRFTRSLEFLSTYSFIIAFLFIPMFYTVSLISYISDSSSSHSLFIIICGLLYVVGPKVHHSSFNDD